MDWCLSSLCMAVAVLGLAVLPFPGGASVSSSFDLAGLYSNPPFNSISGAQGTAYVSSTNQVWVVNSGNGQLGVLDLVAKPDQTYAYSSVVMAVGSSMNLVTGTGVQGGQIRYDTALGYLAMRRQGSTYIKDLGFMTASDFAKLGLDTLSQIDSWPDVSIPGTLLTFGRVFVAYNSYTQAASPFLYAKVRVTAVAVGGALTLDFTSWSTLPRYTVKGTGYNQPTGIVATSNGQTAYITELGSGSLLRVNLLASGIDRASAAVLITGLSSPAGILLDETGNRAFVVERVPSGRLLSIALGSLTVTTLGTFSTPAGLAVRSDWTTFYITAQGTNSLVKFDSTTSVTTTLVTGLSTPNLLSWQDEAQQDYLLVAEQGGARVSGISLATSPPTTTVITSTPSSPSSVAVVAPGVLVVACGSELMRYTISSGYFNPAGPLLLGIGHVPVSKIDALGYADTSSDPGYFFQVKASPFGGTLPLMINYDAARLLGATGASYYYVQVDGVTQAVPWGDYLWDGSKFVFTYATQAGSYFAVRSAAQLWYNAHLGYFLDTTPLSQGSHTISVVFTSGAPSFSVLGTSSVVVTVDNTAPLASIDTIYYFPTAGSSVGKTAVSTCGVVQGTNDGFSFLVRATDPEANLLSWSLSVVWGDNKRAGIAGDSYSPSHESASHQWAGIVGEVPLPLNSNTQWQATVQGDPTSRSCAHTFFLGVWDRTINGWNYIHYSEYHKSITLLLS